MSNIVNIVDKENQFYPTPLELAEKLTNKCKLESGLSILEPSAGKGDLLIPIQEKYKYSSMDYFVIEKDYNLQNILKGKEFILLDDDFLTFNTNYKFDLIIMNPPFKNGEKHLLKAIDLQKNGGQVACILNANTLKNPYSNDRKYLLQLLEEYNADIEYIENAFVDSENKTNVEVALIYINFPDKFKDSEILKDLEKDVEEKLYEFENQNKEVVTMQDSIENLVFNYQKEVKMTQKFIDYYFQLKSVSLNGDVDYFGENVDFGFIELRIGDERARKYPNTINKAIKNIRYKYWNKLFHKKEITDLLTNKGNEELYQNIKEFQCYDFTLKNIFALKNSLFQNLSKNMEEQIIDLFNKFSQDHAYDETLHNNNVHYYNGWKTNKAWKINDKVIVPTSLYSYSYFREGMEYQDFRARNIIRNLFVTLKYLTKDQIDVENIVNKVDINMKNGNNRNINLPMIKMSAFKKGTLHITFTDKEVLKQLNRIGAKSRNWLPNGYGKTKYEDFSEEEKSVIDEFEGKEEYEKALVRGDLQIVNNSANLLAIEHKE